MASRVGTGADWVLKSRIDKNLGMAWPCRSVPFGHTKSKLKLGNVKNRLKPYLHCSGCFHRKHSKMKAGFLTPTSEYCKPMLCPALLPSVFLRSARMVACRTCRTTTFRSAVVHPSLGAGKDTMSVCNPGGKVKSPHFNGTTTWIIAVPLLPVTAMSRSLLFRILLELI